MKRTQAELHTGNLIDKAPKTSAGVRAIAFPAEILPALVDHLDSFTAKAKDAHLFQGPRKGLLRRSNFRDDWVAAKKGAGVSADVHFHDLRHTGNTPASSTGARTRELMTRMGHSSTRAALIYQHMTAGRDRVIADKLGEMIRKEQQPTESPEESPGDPGEPSGT